ncbi:MAG: type II toxin-antitoxin system Phd/YefM family antitoxin [Campylobacterota bacterium]|nr:type II toxin-antitoxin system Phd/YefM family antitoxin [Campylobacterota bacterium]
MQSIQVGQFKSEFSSILDKVQNLGEKYIIEYGKKHKKVAMLVPYEEEKEKTRQFGVYEGKYTIADDFDKEDEELIDSFYDSMLKS